MVRFVRLQHPRKREKQSRAALHREQERRVTRPFRVIFAFRSFAAFARAKETIPRGTSPRAGKARHAPVPGYFYIPWVKRAQNRREAPRGVLCTSRGFAGDRKKNTMINRKGTHAGSLPWLELMFFFFRSAFFYFMGWAVLSFRSTSCAPPSTMLVAETSVSFAFACNSGMESAPQLHIVERTLESVSPTLSLSEPA